MEKPELKKVLRSILNIAMVSILCQDIPSESLIEFMEMIKKVQIEIESL